jgi:myo-inositol-1(or 4)-monophosphatase
MDGGFMHRIHQDLERLAGDTLLLLMKRQAVWRQEIAEEKGAGDIATRADLEAEMLLIEELDRLLPGVPVLSEERGLGNGEGDQLLVVDPLDGTHNYHKGLTHFAVSIALLDKGNPVAAAAAVGAAVEIYSAERHHGAFLNGERLVTRPGPLNPLSLIALPSAIRDEAIPAYWGWLYTKGYKVRNYGSAVSHLCQVASGRFDLALLQKAKVWDFAGAGLIVLEAGGHLGDFSGDPIYPLGDSEGINYRLVASNGAAHLTLPEALLP